MSKQEPRICCDVCGATVETAFWKNSFPIEDGEECPNCGWVQNNWLLEHPDELIKNAAEFEVMVEKVAFLQNCKGTLNRMRMLRFWITEYPDITFRLFGYINSICKRWRESHPELSERFNMCEFKPASNEKELLTTTQPDDTFDD
jgi:hypothetical protein